MAKNPNGKSMKRDNSLYGASAFTGRPRVRWLNRRRHIHRRISVPLSRGGGAEPVQLRRGLLRHVGSGNRGLHSVGVLHREAAVRCRAFSPALPEVNVM